MNTAEFWSLIEKSREGTTGEEQAQRLTNLLARQDATAIFEFDRHLHIHVSALYGLVGTYSTLRELEQACCGIISRGRKTYEEALTNPGLSAKPDAKSAASQILSAASLAYKVVTGLDSIPDFLPARPSP